MERAFRQFVRQRGDLNTIVGEQVYPVQAPQGTTGTRLVYQDVSSVPLLTQDKFGGIRRTRLQIRVVAEDYATAKNLARLLETASNEFRGAFVGSTATVMGAIPQGMRDMPEERPAGSDRGVSSVLQDWMVHWKEG